MKYIFYLILFFYNIISFAQCKTDVIATILDEHIKKELPILSLNKNDIIISVNISMYDKNDFLVDIDAFPLDIYPNVDNIKEINGVRVHLAFKNISKRIERKINLRFKNINEIREVIEPELQSLTYYAGKSSFQINRKDEIYVMFTPDDEYYYNKLKERGIKFSKDVLMSPH